MLVYIHLMFIFSYFIAPVVTSVTINNQQTRASTIPVLIQGYNFGNPGFNARVVVMIGEFPCVNVQYLSDVKLQCYVTGSGANLPVMVTTNGMCVCARVCVRVCVCG